MPVYDRHLGVSSLRGRSLRVPALDAIVVLVRHSAVYASVGTFQLAQLDTSVLKRLVRHLKQQSLLGSMDFASIPLIPKKSLSNRAGSCSRTCTPRQLN